ncbi:MAG: carboxylating nicotinate-nucleotide diphosphorylase [Kiritimatiellia bacterium]|jgi:nicotinate-nucleotide pyrophosphorylase (carboxylating)
MTLPDLLADPRVLPVLQNALEEDIGPGDATTLALVDPGIEAEGTIFPRSGCRVAGAGVAAAVLHAVDPAIRCEILLPDGSDAPADAPILRLRGRAASILTAERVALNFLQRMCGIATMTRRFVRAVADFGTLILDTRKTTPGLRAFEKYSVLCGGGANHRMGLYDRVMVKDNHRRLWASGDPFSLDGAVEAARARFPELAVEVEVESLDECRSALRARPEWILLDNMPCDRMAECVRLCKGISRTEASGGITFERIREVAATGVDAISLGCLTHSAPACDLSLEWTEIR